MLTVRTAAIARGAILSFAIAACTPGKPSPTIGVSIQNLHSEFYTALKTGIQSRARAYNYALILRDADSDAEQQMQVEDFIQRNVNAIVIVPSNSKTIGSAVLEANTAEIPLFTADIDSTSLDSEVAAYIASDNIQGGAKAAQLMCEGVHKHASIAIIDQPEVSSVHDRVAGFTWAVNHTQQCKTKAVRIIADVDVDVRHDGAQGATAEIMQTHRGLAGIFFVNDESMLAAFPRLESRKPCVAPILVGYDAIDEIQRDIDRGAVYGDARQHPDQLGWKTLDEVHDYLNGKRLRNPFVKIAVDAYGPRQCAKRIAESS